MEHQKFKFVGLNIHGIRFDSALIELENFIGSGSSHMINTVTAELVVQANENTKLKKIYNNCSLLLLDSYVLSYLARIFRKPVKEPVNAARLMLSFLNIAQEKKYRLYFLGAKENILRTAITNIRNKYPGIEIVGWHHGYFNINEDRSVLESIKVADPDVVFIAMTSPMKEYIGAKYKKLLKVPVFIGVGGAIDVVGGKTQLAPLWISKMGFEWFYRLCQEPKRMWKRYTITNLKFLWLVIQKELLKTDRIKK